MSVKNETRLKVLRCPKWISPLQCLDIRDLVGLFNHVILKFDLACCQILFKLVIYCETCFNLVTLWLDLFRIFQDLIWPCLIFLNNCSLSSWDAVAFRKSKLPVCKLSKWQKILAGNLPEHLANDGDSLQFYLEQWTEVSGEIPEEVKVAN